MNAFAWIGTSIAAKTEESTTKTQRHKEDEEISRGDAEPQRTQTA
jgi:hypothetical protein